MHLNELRDKAHAMAVEKGWWEKECPSFEKRMLMVSEVAEATEEARKNGPPIYQLAGIDPPIRTPDMRECWNKNLKPEGEAIELADLCIRIADWFGWKRWDLDYVTTYHEVRTISDLVRSFEPKQIINPLDHHLQMVEMICLSIGVNEPTNLGRTFRLVAQYFRYQGWNLEQAISLKMAYNATRPHRHGNLRF